MVKFSKTTTAQQNSAEQNRSNFYKQIGKMSFIVNLKVLHYKNNWNKSAQDS